MGTVLEAEAWADAVRHGVDALEQAVGACDWAAANDCAQALNEQLAAPPVEAATLVLSVYLQAQPVLTRVASTAALARDDVAQSMRRVSRGRKAVNAYG